MPKTPQNGNMPDSDGLWISPTHSLKGDRGDRAWENRAGGPPSNSRYLELADLALGLRKSGPKKKHTKIHDKSKTEPYSQK
ncbi:MAG: hypothetical protein WA738_00410 [Candidatus Angelobacter sp.]